MVCPACGASVADGSRFCSACGQALGNAQSAQQAHYMPAQRPLVRPRYGRMIAGVCAGFAERYGWDVVVVRLVLCLAVLLGAGTPLVAYVIAWIVMPNEVYVFPQTTGGAPL